MLYFTPLWLFHNYQSDLLNPLASFIQPNTPPLWQPSVRSLYLWVYVLFVYLYCSLESTCNLCEIIQYLPFSGWLISLSTVPSRSIHAVTILLWLSNIPLHIYVQQLFYPLATDGHLGCFLLHELFLSRWNKTFFMKMHALKFLTFMGFKRCVTEKLAFFKISWRIIFQTNIHISDK